MTFSFFSIPSTLLYAAYSVAVSASDAEYFAEICRDLAQSLQSEAGRTACEAQDEVFLDLVDTQIFCERIGGKMIFVLRR